MCVCVRSIIFDFVGEKNTHKKHQKETVKVHSLSCHVWFVPRQHRMKKKKNIEKIQSIRIDDWILVFTCICVFDVLCFGLTFVYRRYRFLQRIRSEKSLDIDDVLTSWHSRKKDFQLFVLNVHFGPAHEALALHNGLYAFLFVSFMASECWKRNGKICFAVVVRCPKKFSETFSFYVLCNATVR